MEAPNQLSNSGSIYGSASFRHRLVNMSVSTLLFVYGLMSLTKGELGMPGVAEDPYFVMDGPAMWLMLLAFVFIITSLMTVVVSFHDKKADPIHYQNLAFTSRKAGVAVFILSLLLHYFVFTQPGM